MHKTRVDTSKPKLQEAKLFMDTTKKASVAPYEAKFYRDTVPRRTVMIINETVKNIVETRTVSGQIKDPNGRPVAFATIKIKGKNIGRSTDQNGNFSIPIDKNDKLSVSIVGYSDIELDPNQTNITVNGFNIQSKQSVFNSIQNSTKESALNIFPIPYPVPSATYSIQSNSIPQARYFYQVDSILRAGLDGCRYDERRYYYIPHGFALVTQMEQINKEGSSLDPPDRWSAKIANDLNNPWDYFKALFSTPKGFYRVLIFLYTDIDLSSNGNFISEEEARKWLNNGFNSLPNEIKYSTATNNHSCTLLVYHYEKKPGIDGEMLVPSGLSGRIHFLNSNLSNYIR